MKTLKLIPKPGLKKFEELFGLISDSKSKEFYLYKDGLYIIGEEEHQALDFLAHPIISDLLMYFEYEVVDTDIVKDRLEKNEWEIVAMTEVPPFFYFDLLYEVP